MFNRAIFMNLIRRANDHFERWFNSSLHTLIQQIDNHAGVAALNAELALIPAGKLAKYQAALDYLRDNPPNLITVRCVEPALAQPAGPRSVDAAAAHQELLFPHVDSCLAIAFLLNDGRMIGGHAAMQAAGSDQNPLDPRGNALAMVGQMQALVGHAQITKVVQVGDAGVWVNDLLGQGVDVSQAVLAQVGPVAASLFLSSGNYGGGVDVSFNPTRSILYVFTCNPQAMIYQRAFANIVGAMGVVAL